MQVAIAHFAMFRCLNSEGNKRTLETTISISVLFAAVFKRHAKKKIIFKTNLRSFVFVFDDLKAVDVDLIVAVYYQGKRIKNDNKIATDWAEKMWNGTKKKLESSQARQSFLIKWMTRYESLKTFYGPLSANAISYLCVYHQLGCIASLRRCCSFLLNIVILLYFVFYSKCHYRILLLFCFMLLLFCLYSIFISRKATSNFSNYSLLFFIFCWIPFDAIAFTLSWVP